ncbi:MAG: hypothetical protein ACRBB3_06415 [Alphaproteobacteria bacterium]
MGIYKQTALPILSLFTSVGTLICCALPALLVSIGMGAAMAGLVTNVPWITSLSDYKAIVFTVSGVMLCLSAFMQWRARYAPCPIDPVKARACGILRKISWGMIYFSILVYIVGFFFAFLAVYFL